MDDAWNDLTQKRRLTRHGTRREAMHPGGGTPLNPMETLRIAQVAPLYESVPPSLYGGTERIVSWLTEELVAEGHDVTLFASGDSVTSARLEAISPRALRLDPSCVDQLAHHIVLLERVFSRRDDFDLIHFHIDYLHFPLSRRAALVDPGYARVTTLHGRLDLADLTELYEIYRDEPVVSISDSQRTPLPMANWVGTVYHGMPGCPSNTSGAATGRYLAFLGRISPEKRVDRAIEIARASGRPLRVAAKIDRADREYYEREVAHLMDTPGVEYLGEISDAEKPEFLSGADALLFPIDWEEPFGVVLIEAMACGTPTIAFRRGSTPEVIEDGVTGFLVDSVEEAVEAVGRLDTLSRDRCRAEFERRFTAQRMARDYLDIYRRLLAGRAGHLTSSVSRS
jgi:glycosyltransferase involved in cell wall biosynthesis